MKDKFFKKVKSIPLFTIQMLLLALALYLFVFLHYDWGDVTKSESHKAILTDLEYSSDMQKAWATFDASGIPSYFEFKSRKAAKRGDFFRLEQLVNVNAEVTVTYTDHKDLLRLFDYSGRKQVVEIRTENDIIFDVDDYNQRMFPMKIMWLTFATVALALGISRFIWIKKFGF